MTPPDAYNIEVKWSATTAQAPYKPIAETRRFPRITVVPKFKGTSGVDIARAVAEDYFDTDWAGTIRMIIISPPNAVGTYEVEIIPVIHAIARRIEP